MADPRDDGGAKPAKPPVVKRYWPGKAPDWYQEPAEAQSSDDEGQETGITAVAPPVVLKKAEDPRLRRLAEAKVGLSSSDRGRAVAAPQVISRSQIHQESDEDDAGEETAAGAYAADDAESEEDEEELLARREAVRQRLKRQQEVEVLAAEAGEEERSDEEDASEYETDTDDEGDGRSLMKPVFIPKTERETIAEREALEAEEQQALEREKARLLQRKAETHDLVVQQIAFEEAAAKSAAQGPKEVQDIDTDDEKDEEGEYDFWKSRELQRIKRDREEREKEQREALEKEALRGMTEAERRAWDAAHAREAANAPKKKWRFLQKYWHKGAFFQDASDSAAVGAGGDTIFQRDFSAPTGEDKLDKTVLPKVMQVKNFGRRGRTKWTHLVEEDTTEFENPLAPDPLARNTVPSRKLAGTDQVFERPKTLKT